jgi:isobutyryl-CoA mutase
VGINTFLPEHGDGEEHRNAELIRSTEDEKRSQVAAVRAFNDVHAAAQEGALRRLQATAAEGGNVFAELMETVKSSSLGRISRALYAVGGQYRRNM